MLPNLLWMIWTSFLCGGKDSYGILKLSHLWYSPPSPPWCCQKAFFFLSRGKSFQFSSVYKHFCFHCLLWVCALILVGKLAGGYSVLIYWIHTRIPGHQISTQTRKSSLSYRTHSVRVCFVLFWCRPFSKPMLNLLPYCFHFMFVFLAKRHVGSYLPHQGSNPHSLHWKVKF